jgi:hypothetical protein
MLDKRELVVVCHLPGTWASAGNVVLEHINQLVAAKHVRLCQITQHQLGTNEVGIVMLVILNLEIAAANVGRAQQVRGE